MNSRREYYKEFVHRRTRLRTLIYFIIVIVLFSVVLYDSYTKSIPFHYILFLIGGRTLNLFMGKTQKVKWDETEKKVIIKNNFAGIVVLVGFIFLRVLFLPQILTELSVVLVSDALLLVIMGWYSGRIRLAFRQIESKVFSSFIENQSD